MTTQYGLSSPRRGRKCNLCILSQTYRRKCILLHQHKCWMTAGTINTARKDTVKKVLKKKKVIKDCKSTPPNGCSLGKEAPPGNFCIRSTHAHGQHVERDSQSHHHQQRAQREKSFWAHRKSRADAEPYQSHSILD